MNFKKSLFLSLILGTILIGLFYLKSVFADWRTDLDPPVTTIEVVEDAAVDRCKTAGTTTTCPARKVDGTATRVKVTYRCNDVGPSGCNSLYHREADTGAFTGVSPYDPLNPPIAFVTSSGVGSSNRNVYGYSVDNAGNSEQANTKMQTIQFVYYISGNVFVDTNGNRQKDATPLPGESNYTAGGITIKVVKQSDPLTTIDTYLCIASCDGKYTLSVPNIASNDRYVVSYENLPAGYIMTQPTSGIQQEVRAGSNCWKGSSPDAGCTVGNDIANLNFGIQQPPANPPWFQCIGADCRIDDKDGTGSPPSGFEDDLPTDGTPPVYCNDDSNYPARYASIPNGTTSNMPGIIFSAGSINLGTQGGQASNQNWRVANSAFKPVRSKVIRTSYNYYTSVVTENGMPTTQLNSVAGCSDSGTKISCNSLPANLSNGIYVSGKTVDFNMASYTFTGNKNYVFLINGDLNMNGNILVDNGSTATFSVSNDINIGSSVGGPATTPCNVTDFTAPIQEGCHIEGYYSADRNFTIGASSTLRLNVAGAIVVNANKADDPATIGKIQYSNRDLGMDNNSCPAFSLTERPDFILNAPEFIKHATFTWQEVAP